MQSRDRTLELVRHLEGRRRLLILTHTNPDPDSMGAAMGLACLARQRCGLESELGLVGRVMRAENRAMVRYLAVDLRPVHSLTLDQYDCLALVDSQPGFGHTTLPSGRRIDVVIDHHVPPLVAGPAEVGYRDVRPDVGATSSIVTGYLEDLGIRPSPDVATALFYGVRTDTADLSRNTSALDQSAYRFLMPIVDRQKLALITNPDLPLDYYRALRDALSNMRIYEHVVLCPLGKVASPEMIAEVADLLIRLEGKQVVFCGGIVDRTYHVSVRCDLDTRDAWDLARDALGGEGSFGGHGMVAGGAVPLRDGSVRTVRRLERRLERNILRSLGVEATTVSGLAGT